MKDVLRHAELLGRYFYLVLRQRANLPALLESHARRYPQHPFCTCEGQSHTLGEFNAAVNRRAHALCAQGLQRGEVVALLMENRLAYLETTLALSKLGAVAALIHPALRGEPLVHSLRLSRARVLVLGSECLPSFGEVYSRIQQDPLQHILVEEDPTAAATSRENWPPGSIAWTEQLRHASLENPPSVKLTSRDWALWIYTSGTTGLPRAARVNHYRWYAAALVMGRYAMGLTSKDCLYCPLPLAHSNGIMIAFGSALYARSRLVIARRFSASRFWDEVCACEATAFVYIGELLRYLCNQMARPIERAHRIRVILGNGLRPDIWKTCVDRFGVKAVREFYASTEGNTVMMNVNRSPGTVGRPLLPFKNSHVLVPLDEAREELVRNANGLCNPVQQGHVGELLTRVNRITPFHGYTDAQATKHRLVRKILRTGDCYVRTGDLMRQNAAGDYLFVDRRGDTFRWKGENLSAQEIQETLSGFPTFALVSLYGVLVPHHEGRAGMAAVQLHPGTTLDLKALASFVRRNLAVFAAPVFLRIVAEVERTSTFKLRKVDLIAQGFSPPSDDAIYYLDRSNWRYLPFHPEARRELEQGQLRL